MLNITKLTSTSDPSWTYYLPYELCILASIVLFLFVPWKKKALKNDNNNKSYSLTSDNILNLTAISMIMFGSYSALYMMYQQKALTCEATLSCDELMSYIKCIYVCNTLWTTSTKLICLTQIHEWQIITLIMKWQRDKGFTEMLIDIADDESKLFAK